MNFGKSLLALLVGGFSCNGFAAMEFKEAEITTIKNTVQHDPGTGAAPAKVSEKIHEKSLVATATASMAELTFADSSITRMGANTRFSFQSKERLVKLDQGTVLIHTPPGNGGATVDCGGVIAAVSGTTFMASRDASGNAMFVLLEGQGGLKVTVGTASTVIRPGQAASVGANVIQESKNPVSAAAGPGAASPGSSADGGGGEKGTPSPAAAPKIQVFEVDVKKVVASSPLIVEFKNQLPAVDKIEKTIEVQQAKVQEGKLEKLEVEVVAVKSKDGDPLVGAPKVEKEEMVVVNKKLDVVGQANASNNLDIDTAAGPGPGGPASEARPVAQAAPTRGSIPPPPASLNVVSQVATSTTATVPAGPSVLNLIIQSGGLLRANLDRATFGAATVTLSVPSFPGLNLSPASLQIPAGGTSSGNVAVSLLNPQNFFPGWDTSYNLRPLTLAAVTGSLSDFLSTTALWPVSAIRQTNPVRTLFSLADIGEKIVAALDAYFFFDQRAPGVSTGPTTFFSSSAPSAINLFNPNLMPVDLGIGWTAADRTNGEEIRFFAANNLTAFSFAGSATSLDLTVPDLSTPTPSLDTMTKVFFGKAVRLGGVAGNFGNSSWASPVGEYDPGLFGPPGSPNSILGSWDEWLAAGPAGSPANPNFGAWRTWKDEADSSTGLASSAYLPLIWANASGPAPAAIFMAGSDGVASTADLQVVGLYLTASQARLELFSAGSALVQAAWIENLKRDMGLSSNWSWSDTNIEDKASFKLEAKEKVLMGASSLPPGTVTASTPLPSPSDVLADQKQVRIEALDTSAGSVQPPADSLAVVRSGNSLELRNVVIRGFAGAKLEGAAGRVLVSGTTMRDFKIKELAGLAVNTDAKIQMAVVDSRGDVAGTMAVAEGLPVEKSATGQQVSVAVGLLQRRMEEIKLDANEVNLAADKIRIGEAGLRTQISAQNLITLRANTVLMQNTFMTVLNNSGMINVYVRGVGGNLVNRTYGTLATDMLNFQGFNTFKIGSVAFDVRDQATLDAALANRNINEVTGSGSAPKIGSLNVLQM